MSSRVGAVAFIPAAVFVFASAAVSMADPTPERDYVTPGPPPVVWEVDAKIWQQGWFGWDNPQYVRIEDAYAKTTDNGHGGWAVNASHQSWNKGWVWQGNFPSSAQTSGRFTPAILNCRQTHSSAWSSDFIMEKVYAVLIVRAWVRGGAGTQCTLDLAHGGFWAGELCDTGSARLQGYDLVVTGDGGGCSSVHVPLTVSHNSSLHVTSSQTRVFDEFPQQVYSLLDFNTGGGTDVVEEASLRAMGWESCIMMCGPPTRVVGGGTLLSSIRVSLLTGVRPTPRFDHRYTATRNAASRSLGIELESLSYDEDDGTDPGAGIMHYEWFADGELLQSEPDPYLVFDPVHSGLFAVTLEVTDDEGMTDSVTKPIRISPIPDAVDWDENGSVDSGDFLIALGCLGGADVPTDGSDCDPVDLDTDGDVDALEIAELQAAFGRSASLPLGDLNCDGWVNNGDIDPFILAVTFPEHYDTAYPDCNIMLGDVNGDGWVNNGDIDAFTTLLNTQ